MLLAKFLDVRDTDFDMALLFPKICTRWKEVIQATQVFEAYSTNMLVFYVHVTVHRNKYLYNKTKYMH